MPKRIQRKRTKGWRMPEGAVYVGRPTRWGNPYWVGSWRPNAPAAGHIESVEEAVEHYRQLVAPWLPLDELRGKALACFCPLDQPCHADVLLELANSLPGDTR